LAEFASVVIAGNNGVSRGFFPKQNRKKNFCGEFSTFISKLLAVKKNERWAPGG
jgi:hypothetical protein